MRRWAGDASHFRSWASDWLLARPTIGRKLTHLSGVLLLIPIMSLRAEITLLLFIALLWSLWIAFRFVALGLIGICALLLFADRHIAGAAWLCLVIGDGFAGLCGLAWGGVPLRWNRSKTALGSLAFVVATWPCLTAYLGYASGFRFPVALFISFAVSVLTAVVESLPLTSKDNLLVVLSSGLFCWGATIAVSHFGR